MGSNESGEVLLNIFTSSTREPKTDKKRKLNENSTEIVSKPKKQKTNVSKSKSNKDGKDSKKQKVEKGGAGHVLTKDRPFISNLFTKNPEAPPVPISNENEKNQDKKEVFSSSNVEDNQFGFHQRILSILKGQFDVKHFTQVQLAAIPYITEGRDTLIKSQTGSGKTLAYALPIIHSLMTRESKVQRLDGPYVVVIVPTRELVLQGFETFRKLCCGCTWIVPGQLMGGEKKKSEKARLRKGINVLVATPGRLLDHLKTTETLQNQLPALEYLVFDEADRLMDMGFEKDLNEIIEKIVELRGNSGRKNLQSILASATLNDNVLKLVRLSLYDPVTVDTYQTNRDNHSISTPSTLSHLFLVCPHKLRLVALVAFILKHCRFTTASQKVIVFVSTHKCVDFFVRLFASVLNADSVTEIDHDAGRATGVKWEPVKAGLESTPLSEKTITFSGLHGEMPQEKRTKCFNDFQKSSSSIMQSSVLFCTDVGARGLDIQDIDWIVQFHPPGPPEDYVHRVGRCARAGHHGKALLFLTPSETGYVKFLQNAANIPYMEEIPLLNSLTAGLTKGAKRYVEGKSEKTMKMEDAATCLQLKMENHVAAKNSLSNLVEVSLMDASKAAYFSFIRSYATYPKELKRMGFNVKSLHLGHVAKSFALREPPSKMKDSSDNKTEKKKKKKAVFKKDKIKSKVLSEFSSGL